MNRPSIGAPCRTPSSWRPFKRDTDASSVITEADPLPPRPWQRTQSRPTLRRYRTETSILRTSPTTVSPTNPAGDFAKLSKTPRATDNDDWHASLGFDPNLLHVSDTDAHKQSHSNPSMPENMHPNCNSARLRSTASFHHAPLPRRPSRPFAGRSSLPRRPAVPTPRHAEIIDAGSEVSVSPQRPSTAKAAASDAMREFRGLLEAEPDSDDAAAFLRRFSSATPRIYPSHVPEALSRASVDLESRRRSIEAIPSSALARVRATRSMHPNTRHSDQGETGPFAVSRAPAGRLRRFASRGLRANGNHSDAADDIRWSANRVKKELTSLFGPNAACTGCCRGRHCHGNQHEVGGGSAVVLNPVRALRMQRQTHGSDVLLTPVHRSRRNSTARIGRRSGATSATASDAGSGVNEDLLQQAEYAYVARRNLRDSFTDVSSGVAAL